MVQIRGEGSVWETACVCQWWVALWLHYTYKMGQSLLTEASPKRRRIFGWQLEWTYFYLVQLYKFWCRSGLYITTYTPIGSYSHVSFFRSLYFECSWSMCPFLSLAFTNHSPRVILNYFIFLFPWSSSWFIPVCGLKFLLLVSFFPRDLFWCVTVPLSGRTCVFRLYVYKWSLIDGVFCIVIVLFWLFIIVMISAITRRYSFNGR